MVVDDEAVGLVGGHPVLLVGEAPVHPGDGLEQPVLPQRPVQVQRLLHRRVEASKQHVDHDQRLRLPLRIDEGVDDLLLVELAGCLELRPVVGSSRDDGIGAQAEAVQALGVAQSGGPTRRDDLRLEPIGPHLRLEVLGDVQGDHLNTPLRLGDRLLVGVAAANLRLDLGRLVAEHGLVQPVQGLRPLDGELGQPRLVPDGHRRAVGHRLRNGVGVDEGPQSVLWCCA